MRTSPQVTGQILPVHPTPRGAQLLLQLRTRALNATLADDFRRWYPGVTHKSAATLEDQPEAA